MEPLISGFLLRKQKSEQNQNITKTSSAFSKKFTKMYIIQYTNIETSQLEK